MKSLKMKSLLIAISIGAFSANASAEDCAWDRIGIVGSASTQTIDNYFYCRVGDATVATKKVVVKNKGTTSCSLTINNAKYSNAGSCTTPNIVLGTTPTSGSKICEFNDPSTGTTAGCTERGVGGGGGTVAYEVAKNGQVLLYVNKTNQNGFCSLSGSNSNYYSSGDCNNYRVYKK